MQKHEIVSGMLPNDGDAIVAALDAMSKDGFAIVQTTSCAWDEDSAYYIATLAKPVDNPEAKASIALGERHFMGRSPSVDQKPAGK